MPYKNVKARGHSFVFAYDEVDPTILHIFARHLCQPEDAIEAFFNGETSRNEHRDRFETVGDAHIVYWFWLNEEKQVVMVISCFRK